MDGTHSFFRVTIGNIITFVGAMGGFVGLLISSSITAGKYQEKFDNQDKRLSSIELTLAKISDGFADEKMDVADIKRDVKSMKDENEKRDKRFDADESRIRQVEDVNQTLSTNVQLINQQLNFLSVSKSFVNPEPTPRVVAPRR